MADKKILYSGYFDGFSFTQYSPLVFDAAINQTSVSAVLLCASKCELMTARHQFWGQKLLAQDPNSAVFLVFEPFLSNVFSHGPASAYPPDRSRALFPTPLTILFGDASLNDTVLDAIHGYSEAVIAAGVADGQNVAHAARYPNYALFDTPLEDIYGDSIPRLQAIKRAVDPKDVMGLTGGFKLRGATRTEFFARIPDDL